jgi:hypothetical protein
MLNRVQIFLQAFKPWKTGRKDENFFRTVKTPKVNFMGFFCDNKNS